MSTWSIILFCLYPLAIFCSARAILKSRTPQGAVAWTVGLLSFPFVTVPLYLVFGRSKFNGYRIKRQALDRRARDELLKIARVSDFEVSAPDALMNLVAVVDASKQVGFTGKNKIALLVNADVAYPAMLRAIFEAKKYILFQFYIFRCDETGQEFADALIKKAREGVQVKFLYDEIGSKISKKLIREMEAAGIRVGQFNTTKGFNNRFQINFRNHRKVIVVDGCTAISGGLNIGQEHLGRNSKLGAWRDTSVRLDGPAAMAIQAAFAKDWYWSQGEMLKDSWELRWAKEGGADVLALHTGPVDDLRTCLHAHLALINASSKRLWISTPYMVLPDSLSDALCLAALRGVDVQVLVPARSDNPLVRQASRVYEEELLRVGVQVFRYTAGFLHQKIMVVDDLAAVVGSANLDYRSMFLNFELTTVCTDRTFVESVAAMLNVDFKRSRELSLNDVRKKGFWTRLLERSADLFAPVL